MNALYRIADLQIDELLDTCQQFEKTKIAEEEYFQLLKIYSIFRQELFIEKIKNRAFIILKANIEDYLYC